MATFRLVYRGLFVFSIILIGVILTPLVQGRTMHRQGLSAETTCAWHAWIGRAMGIRVTHHGTPVDAAALYVSNHISWFDICALGSRVPVRFLSKHEVRDWPLVGWLANRAGTLYIKRGGKDASRSANATMADALRNDQNVCLFAEGTTTHGHPRKFHGRLIQSAIDAGCMVQPVALFYPADHDGDHLEAHRAIQFIGDTSLPTSFNRILRARNIRCEVHLLEPIATGGKTRDELAIACGAAVHALIEHRFQQEVAS